MGLIGRYLGVVLGPRGKTRPVPPVVDPSVIASGLQSTTVIKSGQDPFKHLSEPVHNLTKSC